MFLKGTAFKTVNGCLGAGQGVDAIATPLAGYLVDHTGCSRKTWHLIGMLEKLLK
jgi:hypothetical protein